MLHAMPFFLGSSFSSLFLSYCKKISHTKIQKKITNDYCMQLRSEDEKSEITKDWKFAAMVVDRLCLIIFTLFTIISTVAVLFSAPNFIL